MRAILFPEAILSVTTSLRGRPRLVASFLIITVVPIAVLVWLTGRIIAQDRALERQSVIDRVNHDADLIVELADGALSRFEEGSISNAGSAAHLFSNDAVDLIFEGDRISGRSTSQLLFIPALPDRAASAENVDVFRVGEELEFRAGNYRGAVREFRRLAQTSDSARRAGALIRAARNLRKEGHVDEALAVYDELARFNGIQLDRVPVDLIARAARCALLAEQHRTTELRREARSFRDDLEHARWRLERASYFLHEKRTTEWLATVGETVSPKDTSVAIAGAAERLFNDWQRTRRGEAPLRMRQSFSIDGISITIVARRSGDTLVAVIAGTESVANRLRGAVDRKHVSVALIDGDATRIGPPPAREMAIVTRSGEETRLPWALQLASADSRMELDGLATRRRLLLTGLAITALLTLAGGYFTARGTARELAAARLESEFVSAVSHEFRTPLTSLRHLTDLLAHGAIPDEERRRQYYAVMSRETERLQGLVERLLDFGRMEAGRREYAHELADPADVVEAVIKEFGADGRLAHRRLRVTAPNASVHRSICVDRAAMELVFRNLIENALKYSPDSAPVHIDLAESNDGIAIRVRDEGAGILRSERDAIFEKFVRGSAARTLEVKGTGVGLAMVRHIVRAHGGEVTVESEPGRGSTFTVMLPRPQSTSGVNALERADVGASV